MPTKSPLLSFKVHCTACYGTEVWRLERIVRKLSEIPGSGVLAPLPGVPVEYSEPDIEFFAERFIIHHKRIECPGCEKVGVLAVERI